MAFLELRRWHSRYLLQTLNNILENNSCERNVYSIPSPSFPSFASMSTSSVFADGLGCEINSMSFACILSARAFSTGPKTLDFKAELFALIELERAPLAIVVLGCSGVLLNVVVKGNNL